MIPSGLQSIAAYRLASAAERQRAQQKKTREAALVALTWPSHQPVISMAVYMAAMAKMRWKNA
jgi:hypothetical protein